MSDTDINNIRTGHWTDYSKGSIAGRLITLPNRDARFLIAFLALFVRFMGSRIWSIFCFIIHQVRSDPQPRDGLYHQRQVLLRNDPSAFTTLVNLLRLSWTWKQRAAQPWGRHIPLIALCIVHIAFFAVASLLVGFAATTGTDGLVLLRGEDVCYWWHASGSNLNAVTLTSFWATERPLLQEVHVYAEDCYDVSGLTVTNTKPCNSSFASANIGFSVELNVDCPFPDPSFCRSSKEGAVRMTSELINSNKHLGLNAKLEDQINFRQIMTCSPLPDTIDTPYANDVTQSVFDGTSGNFDITERYFRYSANRNNDSEAMIAMWSNSTAQIPYHFDSELWLSNTTDPSLQPPWTLNEGLAPDMADFTLILITNAVTYTDSSNDTIFGTIDCEPGQSCSSRTFSALGCTQQFQFCNPVNGLCTRQGGWFDIGYLDQTSLGFKLWNDDGLTELQHGTIYNIHIASMYAQLPYLFSGLQSDTLFASRQLLTPDSRLSSPLPNNQTVQEYKYWFSMTLAALQDSFIQLALTPASDDLVPFVKNSSLAELCQRQKVRSSDYTSISVVGLVVIIVVGCAVIALSVVLPNIVAEMQRAFGTEPYLRREWRANAIFHLQRSAFEARGIGNWSSRDKSVPLTMPFEKFQLPPSRGKGIAVTQPTHEITRTINGDRYAAVPVNGMDHNPTFSTLILNQSAMEPLIHRDESETLWPRSSVHRRGESL